MSKKERANETEEAGIKIDVVCYDSIEEVPGALKATPINKTMWAIEYEIPSDKFVTRKWLLETLSTALGIEKERLQGGFYQYMKKAPDKWRATEKKGVYQRI